MHGGKTPIKHGLFSKFKNPAAQSHVEAARELETLRILQETIPALAGLLSFWMENGVATNHRYYLATCTLMSKITTAVETYERLTNPGGMGGNAKEQIGEYLAALSAAAAEVWNEEETCED